MNTTSLIKYITMSILLAGTGAHGQTIQNIAGQYKIATSLLVIEPDSTFLLLDMGILEKGVVETDGASGKLIFNKLKNLFVLYGRINNSITSGNVINYKGESRAGSLINYDSDNIELKKMKKVFNDGANCIPNPILINNPHSNPKFYFSIQDSKEVYAFENNQGYNDFIVLNVKPTVDVTEIKFTVNKDGKSIALQSASIAKLPKPSVSEAEIKFLISMHDKASGELPYFLCNPAYNTFEESGIHLEQFDKVHNGNEYYFKNKSINAVDDKDYHNDNIIYEYKKIDPVILTNQKYTVDTIPVFTFNCNNE